MDKIVLKCGYLCDLRYKLKIYNVSNKYEMKMYCIGGHLLISLKKIERVLFPKGLRIKRYIW